MRGKQEDVKAAWIPGEILKEKKKQKKKKLNKLRRLLVSLMDL